MATGNGSQVRDIRQKTNAEIMPTVVLSCSCNGCRTNAPASEKSTVKPTCIILSSDTENEEPSVSKTFTSTGLPSWRRKINGEYEIGEVIGVGGFGTVYAGIRKRDNFSVAVKVIPKDKVTDWGEISGIKVPLELELLVKVSGSPGVIKMVDWYEDSEEFILIMERPSPVTDLFDLRAKYGPLPEYMARVIIMQIIKAVHHCHVKGVIHRDIKDENILLNEEDLTVKLIDFGCGAMAQVPQFTTCHGTAMYCPPEWFISQKYSGTQFDVWGIGVLLYMLVENSDPFKTVTEIKEKEIVFRRKKEISQSCQDLIRYILCKDPEKRPLIDEISVHRWFFGGLSIAPRQSNYKHFNT